MKARSFFFFFLLSGFCSLVYQIVWLRLAMASFGVTTPMVSIVLSVFMAGLALGSWGAGLLTRGVTDVGKIIRYYALAEFLIGISALAVPRGLSWGRHFLAMGAWGSLGHYLGAGLLVAFILLPYTTCMGATFPLGMAALRKTADSNRSFSYLYLANVIGATLGTLISAFFLIEILGFRGTLVFSALLNFLLAFLALFLSRHPSPASNQEDSKSNLPSSPRILLMLFVTGLASMGLEVVWTRKFTPYIGTEVYAFAIILAIYLAATFLGSTLYRQRTASKSGSSLFLWSLAGLSALLSLLATDPRLPVGVGFGPAVLRVVLGVMPFSAILGFLTPMLVDEWSAGDGERAGKAYAVNVLGCILGPLLAGFLFLPLVGERWSLLLLALPFYLFALAFKPKRLSLALAALAPVLLLFGTWDFEDVFIRKVIRRDYTATAIAAGQGLKKSLLINGVGITKLTTITKMMAHLPLAILPYPPRNGLVICFGMGTCFRSMLSWGIPTTAVELVPSVPGLFGYFFEDGPGLLRSPLSRVVIDDGRRFLERSEEKFDVITLDPPPPVPAAGSSLLYSKELYEVAKKRLQPEGILQQWIPDGEPAAVASFCRALGESFPYLRIFRSCEGWGLHCIASMSPLQDLPASRLARRLPAGAKRDLLEWAPQASPEGLFESVLVKEVDVEQILAMRPHAPALRDDRPVNEYFFLRGQLANITML